MKKLLIVMALMFLLVGCSSNSEVKLTNGDELLWSSPKESYTKQDLYNDMKSVNEYSSIITNSVINTIAKVDGIDLQAEIKELEEQYDSYIEILGDYTVSYFGDKDNFINKLLGDKIVERYLKNDIEANYDSYVSENNPYYGEVFYVEDEEMANDIKTLVEEGNNTVEYAASSAGYSESINPAVYTDKSDLPVEVKEVILNSDAPIFDIKEVETFTKDSNGETTSKTRYYIINVTSKDVNTFKDAFVDYIIQNNDKDSFIQSLIDKHSIKFYDQSAYDSFSSVYEGAK